MPTETPQIIWVYSKERFLSDDGWWKAHVTISNLQGDLVKENAFDMWDEYVIHWADDPAYPQYDYTDLETTQALSIIAIGPDETPTTFPHIGTSGGEIFIYNEDTQEYEAKATLDKWNQAADEYINEVDENESPVHSNLAFSSFWYQDGKIYAMTSSYSPFQLWEYISVGKATAGPHTISTLKTDKKYTS
jgi:hypothetical protein